MILHFTTLGCKVNQYETSALQTLLLSRGHRLAEMGETADIAVINTCAVTGESERKSRQAIRKARKDHPGALVAVCGCFSELSPEEVTDLEADLVRGSTDRTIFAEELEQLINTRRGAQCAPADPTSPKSSKKALDQHEFELLPPGSLDGRTRALLKVQDGCENFCTYCIIPYARGPVRSIPLDEAVRQARTLMEDGYLELVITGIEISSWGKDLPGDLGIIDLVEAVCKAASTLRIRLGSLEPRTVTADFCDRLKQNENLCPHFHLSLQSGSDAVLRRMGRRYDTARFQESVTRLQTAFPDCGITTDLIVGFPGESEADVQDTLALMRSCGFSAVHVFPYSARAGTKAAQMADQVPKAERSRRAKLVRTVAAEIRRNFLDAQIGKILPVLFESEGEGGSSGHTPHYCTVRVERTNLKNGVYLVDIHDRSGEILIGEIL